MRITLIWIANALWVLSVGRAEAQEFDTADASRYGAVAQGPREASTSFLPLPGAAAEGTTDLASPAEQFRMYEDIEIMLRIMHRAIRNLYGSLSSASTSVDYDKDGWPDLLVANGHPNVTDASSFFWQRQDLGRAHEFAIGEGTYLKGYGVVYSMSIPAPLQEPKPESTKSDRKSISLWERVRKQLQGEPVASDDAKPQPKEITPADVVLKVLADNGHNFSQLAQDEHVTVVMTFRQRQSCTQCHMAVEPFRGSERVPSDLRPIEEWLQKAPSDDSGPSPGSPPAPQSQAVPRPPTERLAEAMLLNQGVIRPARWEQGSLDGEFLRRAYLDLLGVLPTAEEAQTFEADTTPDKRARLIDRLLDRPEHADAWTQKWSDLVRHRLAAAQLAQRPDARNYELLGDLHLKQGRAREASDAFRRAVEENPTTELYTKLAQAYLAQGDADGARKALDKAVELRAALVQKKRAGESPAFPLPQKLIISASKELLDQVGAGKISFEDFKKAAAVEYLGFPYQHPMQEIKPTPAAAADEPFQN